MAAAFFFTPTSTFLIPRIILVNTQCTTASFHFFNSNTLRKRRRLKRRKRLQLLYYCSEAAYVQEEPNNSKSTCITLTKALILLTFSLTLLTLRLLSDLLLPDFPQRWTQLIAFSSQAEATLSRCPPYLFQAVVAYEDRRFFTHFGIDPFGLARAALSFSALGGGSTITQQLVKNVFLKNQRTFFRKIVEMLLAMALERTISKSAILNAYLCKIYWGHGIYGIESASGFYFGKHPSLLSLGECAMLVGLIPAPEVRSPFRNFCRGKIYQARVVKRMVKVGLLDTETALSVVKESLHLNSDGLHYNGFLFLLSCSEEDVSIHKKQQGGMLPNLKDIWDWETESKIWEVKEDTENWAKTCSPIN